MSTLRITRKSIKDIHLYLTNNYKQSTLISVFQNINQAIPCKMEPMGLYTWLNTKVRVTLTEEQLKELRECLKKEPCLLVIVDG